MAKKFLVNIDLGGNQLLSARVQNGTGAPTAYGKGQLWYDSSNNLLKVYNGSSFDTLSTSAGGVTAINGLQGGITLYGTANQITVTASSTSVTFALDTSNIPTASNTLTFSNKTISASTNTISGLTNTNLSGTAEITNANLANSSMTIGSTSIALGSTSSVLAGITSLSATNFYGTFNGSATYASNSASLGSVAASGYALLSSANFTAASVSGSVIATQSYVTGLGYQTSSGSVAYATTTGSVTGATSANTNSAYVVRDSNGRAQFTDPSALQDAATKNYVDTVAQGLNTHDSVTVATTATLTASYTAGTTDASGGLGIGASLTATSNTSLTIDTVAVAVNDRVLVKNQSTATQNGIYTVTASGSGSAPWVLVRAEDANNSIAAEMSNGDFIFVISGSLGGSTGWVLNSATTTGTPAKAIKIGTDSVTYTQFSGQGTYTAGNGIIISGNTFSVRNGTGLDFVSTSLTFASGTTSQSATGVSGGVYTYATQRQTATITGNTALTSFIVNHNLNTRDVNVQVYQTSATPDTQYAEVEVDIARTSTSTITVTFASAIATGDTYNVVIVG